MNIPTTNKKILSTLKSVFDWLFPKKDNEIDGDDLSLLQNTKNSLLQKEQQEAQWLNKKQELISLLKDDKKRIGEILLDNYKKFEESRHVDNEMFDISNPKYNIMGVVNIINGLRADNLLYINPLFAMNDDIKYVYYDLDDKDYRTNTYAVSCQNVNLGIFEENRIDFSRYMLELNKWCLNVALKGALLKANKIKKPESIASELINEAKDIGRRSKVSNATWAIVPEKVLGVLLCSPHYKVIKYKRGESLPLCGELTYMAGNDEMKIHIYLDTYFNDDNMVLLGYKQKNDNIPLYICPYLIYNDERFVDTEDGGKIKHFLNVKIGKYFMGDSKANFTRIKFLGIK